MKSLAAPGEDSKRIKNFDEISHNFAVGIATMPNLRLLELDGLRIDESFFRGVTAVSAHCPVSVRPKS